MSDENEQTHGSVGGQLVPSSDEARQMLSELIVHSGLSVADANALAAQHGAMPFEANSVEVAKLEKRRLMEDPTFRDKFLAGDGKARADMIALDVKILGAGNQ
jgi:hypothetical protein